MAQSLGNLMEREVRIVAEQAQLAGTLAVPTNAAGIVLFAHGSGSSRRSPRNRQVAHVLNGAGIATLLFDLLTAEEEAEDRYTGEYRFDVRLLAGRMEHATRWVKAHDTVGALAVGYFGASTGSAGALIAAATLGGTVRAVVSRGGRPDLAPAEALQRVGAPTLLIVGGRDEEVERLNRKAFALLRCEKELAIVPNATHLFEEPGALEQVAELAKSWFVRHLAAA